MRTQRRKKSTDFPGSHLKSCAETGSDALALNSACCRLLLAAVRGDQSNFVRKDFIEQAWALFDPVLKAMEARNVV